LVLAAGAGVAWFVTHYRHPPTQLAERQLTANPPEDNVMTAAISPDGKDIAYTDHVGLYLRSIDSGGVRAISIPDEFRNRIGNLEWFPGGGKLLAEVAGLNGTGIDLWVMTTLGEAAPRSLYRRAGQPAISPDGRLVAFVRSKLQGELDNPGAVWVGGVNGESPRQLVTEPAPGWLSSPVWSPDGRWIAYARISTAPGFAYASVIEVRPAAGAGPSRTLVSSANLPASSSPCGYWADPCLRWSPDWRLVFFVHEAAPPPSNEREYSLWGIWMNPRTGAASAKPARMARWGETPGLPGDGFEATSPTFAANAKRLSFMKGYSWTDVYWAELAPDGTSMKPARRFTLDNRGGSVPFGWTRDSKAIIFRSGKSGKQEIFRQGLNQTVATAILQCPGKECYSAALTADGSWTLYTESTPALPGVPPPPSRLMRWPVAGGSPEMVLEEPGGDWWAYACPVKSGSCVFSRYQGKDLVFYRLDPTWGLGEQLGKIEVSPNRVAEWNVSPDGSRLALVGGADRYQGRIEVLSFGERTWHEVPVQSGWGVLQSISWTADGKGFFVTSSSWSRDSNGLLHVTSKGKVSPLLRSPGVQWLWGPVPSPDGRYLAYMANTTDSNVWMLEGF